MQLRTDEIIRAKLPDFLDAIARAVEDQAARLQQTFPDKAGYKTSFRRGQNDFILTKAAHPTDSISGNYSSTAKTITISLDKVDAMNIHPYVFEIHLDANDNLYASFKGTTKMPAAIAEFAIKKLCKIQ